VEIQTMQRGTAKGAGKVNNFTGLTDDSHLSHPNPSDR
jgi:hypothetical protein